MYDKTTGIQLMILILQISYVTGQIWLAGQNLGFQNQEDQPMSPDGVCLINVGPARDGTTV